METPGLEPTLLTPTAPVLRMELGCKWVALNRALRLGSGHAPIDSWKDWLRHAFINVPAYLIGRRAVPESATVDEDEPVLIGKCELVWKRIETPPKGAVDEDRCLTLSVDFHMEIGHDPSPT
ncbi:MAG: hypothetical protein HYY39_09150 [Armatimonadetes bacterium]|nr:hypothetical protein [Armatimonadota bacterium]